MTTLISRIRTATEQMQRLTKGVFEAFGSPPISATLIGSATYMDNPSDIDFAVLVGRSPGVTAKLRHYVAALVGAGWQKCGVYEREEGVWEALRHGDVNIMLTTDTGFHERYLTAMEVCKVLRLQRKAQRVAVCQIVRDGLTAERVRIPPEVFDADVRRVTVQVNLFKPSGKWAYGGQVSIPFDCEHDDQATKQALIDNQSFVVDGAFADYVVAVTHIDYELDPRQYFFQRLYPLGAFAGMTKGVL